MGKTDTIVKQYMKDNEVFADAFNYLLYDGEQVIEPDRLHILDTTEVEVPYGADGAVLPVQKIRDELKYLTVMADNQTVYAILGIENQTEIQYAMPIKNMLYDAMEYAGQVNRAAASHRKKKDYKGHDSSEYLSGFFKEDRLIPVVTLVVFFSPEPWDGPMCLYDMLYPVDKGILSMIENYKLNLIAPNYISDEDLQKFRTNLREVLAFIKYSKDKIKLKKIVNDNERYTRMDKKAAMVIEACTKAELNIEGENKEVVNMCQAIREMRLEERNEGRLECTVEYIKSIMDYSKCTAEKAMDILKVPEFVRKQCRERLQKI